MREIVIIVMIIIIIMGRMYSNGCICCSGFIFIIIMFSGFTFIVVNFLHVVS